MTDSTTLDHEEGRDFIYTPHTVHQNQAQHLWMADWNSHHPNEFF